MALDGISVKGSTDYAGGNLQDVELRWAGGTIYQFWIGDVSAPYLEFTKNEEESDTLYFMDGDSGWSLYTDNRGKKPYTEQLGSWSASAGKLQLRGFGHVSKSPVALKLLPGMAESSNPVLEIEGSNSIRTVYEGEKSTSAIQALEEFTIQGTGSLGAYGGTTTGTNTYSAGIDAYGGQGNLTIKGVQIDAQGGNAANGSSYGIVTNHASGAGKLTIESGKVEARGKDAGINDVNHSAGIKVQRLEVKDGSVLSMGEKTGIYVENAPIIHEGLTVKGTLEQDGSENQALEWEQQHYSYVLSGTPVKYVKIGSSGSENPDKTEVTIGGDISIAVDKTYDGKAAAYSGTPTFTTKDGNDVTASIGKPAVKWQKKVNGSYQDIKDAPKDAGEYKLIVSVPDTDKTYSGKKEFVFKISKKVVSVKPKNATMKPGETLTPSPTPEFSDNAVDVTREGTYTITWTNMAETEFTGTTAANYDVTKTAAGTLTISKDSKREILVEGVELKDKTYDGQPAGYTGTPRIKDKETGEDITDSIGKPEVKWQKKDKDGNYQDISDAPKDPGEYRLVMSVPDDNGEYGGSQEFPFTIAKKAVAVRPKDITIKPGESRPEFTLEFHGLADGDTLTPSAAPKFTDNAEDLSREGTYTITWSNKDDIQFTGSKADNYDITKSATGRFTITRKTEVEIFGITFRDKVYDGSAAEYEGTARVRVKDSGQDVTGAVGDLSVKWEQETADGTWTALQVAPANAGTYRLTVSVPDSQKDYIGSLEFIFTISKKSLTVKSKDQTGKTGEGRPVFTLELVGAVDGETLTPSQAPVFTDNAGDLSKAGTYAITWSNMDAIRFVGFMAENYNIVKQATGTFTVKAGKGFDLELPSGKLKITSDEGFKNWMSDSSASRDKITEVEISEDVTSIPANAFKGCGNLVRVNVKGNTPAALGAGAFDGAASGMRIYVPKGRGGSYRDAWKPYEDRIVENEKTEAIISIPGFAGKAYDGQPAAYTGEFKVVDKATGKDITQQTGTLGVRWQQKDGNGNWIDLGQAPKNAGDYKLILSVEESISGYYGSQEYQFTIAKRDITVRPKSQAMKPGGGKPEYILEYTGLVPGETLTPSETPVFTDNVKDPGKVGTYVITWSNKDAIGFSGAENYQITKVGSGTLVITEEIYRVTVAGSYAAVSGQGDYAPGMTVNIYAGARPGYTFDGWTGTGGSYLPKNYTGGTKILHNNVVPDYTVEGVWRFMENGKWRLNGPDGNDYVDCWVFAYNPYADTSKGQSPFDWFLFDKDGYMVPGWYTDEFGNTYYLNPFLDLVQGSMATGWKLIDGKWYYFNEEPDGTRGRLLRNTTTPDGYYADENGVRVD